MGPNIQDCQKALRAQKPQCRAGGGAHAHVEGTDKRRPRAPGYPGDYTPPHSPGDPPPPTPPEKKVSTRGGFKEGRRRPGLDDTEPENRRFWGGRPPLSAAGCRPF